MPDAIVFRSASGDEVDLTDMVNNFVTSGRGGEMMAAFSFASHEVPNRPGETLSRVKTQARDVVLPLALTYPTEAAFRSAVRSLARALDPNYSGELRVTAPDGATRILYCRYADGLNSMRWLNGVAARAALTFRAFDPFWYSASAQSFSFDTGEAASFFPFFPLVLASSTVFAQQSVSNGGDVETYPIWTIDGPGNGVVLKNLTTGETLTLSTVLAAGEQVVIDTRPGYKAVTRGDENLFGDLSAESALWSLARGENSIRIEMDGATSESAVSLRFTPRYWSA